MPANGVGGPRLIPVIFTHLSSLYGCKRVHWMVRDGQNQRRHLPQMRAENPRRILRRGLRPAARRPLRSVRPQRFLHERQTRPISYDLKLSSFTGRNPLRRLGQNPRLTHFRRIRRSLCVCCTMDAGSANCSACADLLARLHRLGIFELPPSLHLQARRPRTSRLSYLSLGYS